MKEKYSESEIVKILGGRVKDSKKSVVIMMIAVAFTVAIISPFVFESSVNVGGISNKKESTCTVPSSEAVDSLADVVATEEETEIATEIASTTHEVTTLDSTKPVATEAPLTMKKHVATTSETTTKKRPVTTSVTTTKPTTTEITTTKPTTIKPTTPESITSKPITTTTTRHTTTESITPDINIAVYIQGNNAILDISTYPTDGNVECKIYDTNVAVLQGKVIVPKSKGSTTVSCSYTYNGITVTDFVSVSVDILWSDSYETQVYEEPCNFKKLVGQKTQYKYYRYLCSSCMYRDWYGYAGCRECYGNGGCSGRFEILEERWSETNPNTLTSHSVKGVPSFIDSNNAEWYWCPSYYYSKNGTRTVYRYQTGELFISKVS